MSAFFHRAMNGAKPPVTERPSFLMLPDDLVFNCLARVSRLYYPTLSLVSKRFRSLLVSLELYNTRTLLGCTESCLYVCLQFPQDLNSERWFTLCRRPTHITNPKPNPRWFTSCFPPYRALMDQTMKKKDNESSKDIVLVSIQTRNPPFLRWWEPWSLIAVGHNVYKIDGNDNNGLPSCRVFIMDCRSHTWHQAPSMRVARKHPNVCVLDGKIVCVLDGKIYLVDIFDDMDPSSLVECFDLETQTWEHMEDPDAELLGRLVDRVLANEGEHYVFGNKPVVNDSKQKRWDELRYLVTLFGSHPDCSCEIDNVLYGCGPSKKLEWYDSKERDWRVLKGLRGLPDLQRGYNCVRLVAYGENIAVFWETCVSEEEKNKKKNIWCAEISLERRSGQEIRGKVEWCHVVLTVPISSTISQVLAVTV